LHIWKLLKIIGPVAYKQRKSAIRPADWFHFRLRNQFLESVAERGAQRLADC